MHMENNIYKISCTQDSVFECNLIIIKRKRKHFIMFILKKSDEMRWQAALWVMCTQISDKHSNKKVHA